MKNRAGTVPPASTGSNDVASWWKVLRADRQAVGALGDGGTQSSLGAMSSAAVHKEEETMARRLSWAEIQTNLRVVRLALTPGPEHPQYRDVQRRFSRPVILEVPTGELVGDLAGFAWAWKMQRRLEGPFDLTGHERLNAQGMEKKWRVAMSFWDALIVASRAAPHRVSILIASNA